MKHEGQEILIAAGLDPNNPWLDGHEYVDCKILGPAVLAMVNNTTLDHNDIQGSLESVLWRLDRERVIGCIGVRNTKFVNCVFVGVGFAGNDEFIAQMRRGTKEVGDVVQRRPWWERMFRQ